uniref:Uncharacterized protein n=1 Tax=viral metagenome TaxID=1070528 RepID=A0A6C0JV13_9ZZZZ
MPSSTPIIVRDKFCGIELHGKRYVLRGVRLHEADVTETDGSSLEVMDIRDKPSYYAEEIAIKELSSKYDIGHDPSYTLKNGKYRGFTLDKLSEVEPLYLVYLSGLLVFGDEREEDSYYFPTKYDVNLSSLWVSRHKLIEAADPCFKIANPEWWEARVHMASWENNIWELGIEDAIDEIVYLEGFIEPLYYKEALALTYTERLDRDRCADFIYTRNLCVACGTKLDFNVPNQEMGLHELCSRNVPDISELGEEIVENVTSYGDYD